MVQMAGNSFFIAKRSAYSGRGWKRGSLKRIWNWIVQELWEDLEGVNLERVKGVEGIGLSYKIIIFK